MKIVSWNLKNIGYRKLFNTFSQKFIDFELGNDVGDYIARLVMADACWDNLPNYTQDPADIFVVIELKTGGKRKGYQAMGTCAPTLDELVSRLNTMAEEMYPNAMVPPYVYDYEMPEVVGFHETVGVIYNTESLTYVGSGAVRNTQTNNWINPRTPFYAEFTTIGANPYTFRVVGIHAPPPSGGDGVRYRPPIQFCVQLPNIQAAGQANTFIMGDFNCNPASSYVLQGNNGNVNVFPFANLNGFGTLIANGTLSSVRTRPNNLVPPANYLNDAYDNILYNMNMGGFNATETIGDLIGNARDMSDVNTPNVSVTNIRLLVNAYNTVSDHLPVIIEWT